MISSWGIRSGLLIGLWLISCSAAAICSGTNQNTAVPLSTPTTDFADNGDGTVTHVPTGLLWKRCSEGQEWSGSTCTGAESSFDWQGALTHADEHSFAGHTDGRLPNVKELKSIVERRCWSPAINTVIFPAATSGWFWSASPYANDTFIPGILGAWQVEFHNGSHFITSRREPSLGVGGFGSVRLVRTVD